MRMKKISKDISVFLVLFYSLNVFFLAISNFTIGKVNLLEWVSYFLFDTSIFFHLINFCVGVSAIYLIFHKEDL